MTADLDPVLARALTERDDWQRSCDRVSDLYVHTRRDLQAARAELADLRERVEALHYRRPWQSTGGQEFVTFGQTDFPDQCAADGCRDWPCPTITALTTGGDRG